MIKKRSQRKQAETNKVITKDSRVKSACTVLSCFTFFLANKVPSELFQHKIKQKNVKLIYTNLLHVLALHFMPFYSDQIG